MVDNGSADGSVAMVKKDFPEVILIQNKKNVGYGKSNNMGIKIATGIYSAFKFGYRSAGSGHRVSLLVYTNKEKYFLRRSIVKF